MRLAMFSAALAAGLLFAGLASAQPPGFGPGGFGPGGFGGGLAMMIGQNKQLQDELKMDKEQVDKLTAAFAKVRDDLKDDMPKLFDRNISQDERDKITKKMSEANTKAVESVLKSEQVKRLHQIENQQAGVGMFAKEDVRKALKLSDDQKEKLDEINKEYQKDLRDLSGGRGGFGGFDPETRKKRDDLQKETMTALRKVLNDDQKTTLKDLTGEPFELRFTFGGPGGPGGFGGPPQPGKVLSPFVQDQLKLTSEQKKQMEDLQKEVDEKLAKILTDEQKKQLKDMQQGFGRGPGGPPPNPRPPERP
ncbi:MAG TPA: hypothetical protein VKA46_41600 [Gemmataceae bacterium]|nr:hypothetical protein [Gemmataceae bacterium]